MNSKNGFTLIELLATIALLSLLVVFVVPKVYDYLSQGYLKAMMLQVNNIESAAKLYLEDYCKSPINSSYVCPDELEYSSSGYTGKIDLQTLIDSEYIEKVTFKNETCDGYIIFSEDDKINAYIKCGEYSSEGYDPAEQI